MEFNAFSEHACINCAHHKNDQKTEPFSWKIKRNSRRELVCDFSNMLVQLWTTPQKMGLGGSHTVTKNSHLSLVFAYQDKAVVHFLNMLVQIVLTTKMTKNPASFDWKSKEQAHLPLDPPTYLYISLSLSSISLSLSLSLSPPLSPLWPHRTSWMNRFLFFGGSWWSWAQGILGALKGCHWFFFWCWPSWAQDALEQLKGCHWFLGSCWPQQPNTNIIQFVL